MITNQQRRTVCIVRSSIGTPSPGMLRRPLRMSLESQLRPFKGYLRASARIQPRNDGSIWISLYDDTQLGFS